MNSPEILGVLGCDDLAAFQSQRRDLDAFLEAAKPDQVLALVDQVDLGMTGVSIKLVGATLTDATNLTLSEDALACSLPVDLQKRGTGQTMVFGDAAPNRDMKLIANVAKAHAWLDRIKSGETYDQIATADGTSKRRVQQMLDLAFLAPDIVRSICEVKQPARLTSEWFKTHRLPADWTAQRALIATIRSHSNRDPAF